MRKPRKMASGRPISVNGMGVSVIFTENRLPWASVTRMASNVLMARDTRMRCNTEPRRIRNSRKPAGRSRTIIAGVQSGKSRY
ncbi:hypothetical protein D3C85_1576930 [compost metagenome]